MNAYRGKHVSPASRRVSSPYCRGRHQVRPRRRKRWLIAVLILIALILAYPFIEARFLLQTEIRAVKSEDLPLEANNLRIVYLSDIHYGFGFSDWDLGRLVSRINALRPDLVLMGGDYGADQPSAIRFFNALQKQDTIRSRYGIFGVIGETDRGDSDFTANQVTEAMTNAGVTPLVNKTAVVNIATRKIYIAGVDDVSGHPDLKSVARTVNADDFVIFLSHNPTVIPDAQLAKDASGNLGWFDLGLFGHTHGGQMLFFSSLLDVGQDVPERYRSGWLKENRVDLLISRGVGTSRFPGRLFCFPQIHYMTVTYK